MSDTTVFDQLVSTLDRGDRRKLLEEISATFSTADAPLARAAEEPEVFDAELELARMPMLQRIFFRIKALFLSVDMTELLKEKALRRLRDRIEREAKGLVDFRSGTVTQKMQQALSQVSDAVTFFADSLAEAFKNRKEFVPFLVGLELPVVHGELAALAKGVGSETEVDTDETAARSKLTEQSREILERIPPFDRVGVYSDMQALSSFQELTAFDFDSLLRRFESAGSSVELAAVRSILQKLATVLHNASLAPSSVALEAVFLFRHRTRLQQDWDSLAPRLEESLNEAHSHLARIREFNTHVPMVALARYANKNLGWTPPSQTGGEDWFVLYKEFWSDQIALACRSTRLVRQKRELKARATALLEMKDLPEIEGAMDLGLQYIVSLRFLKGLATVLFKRAERALKIVYLHGRFYKEQNQREYTDVFGSLSGLAGRVREFEKEFESDGRFGGRLEELRNDRGSVHGKDLKRQEIKREADGLACSLVDHTTSQLHILCSLLGGIVGGEPGGRYDTLSNLEDLGGRESQALRKKLAGLSGDFKEAWQVLCDLKDSEIAVVRSKAKAEKAPVDGPKITDLPDLPSPS